MPSSGENFTFIFLTEFVCSIETTLTLQYVFKIRVCELSQKRSLSAPHTVKIPSYSVALFKVLKNEVLNL